MWEGGGRFNTDSSGENNSEDLNEFPHLPLLRQSAALSIKSCVCTTKQSTILYMIWLQMSCASVLYFCAVL